jgi:hypothetical protein
VYQAFIMIQIASIFVTLHSGGDIAHVLHRGGDTSVEKLFLVRQLTRAPCIRLRLCLESTLYVRPVRPQKGFAEGATQGRIRGHGLHVRRGDLTRSCLTLQSCQPRLHISQLSVISITLILELNQLRACMY